MREVWLSKEPVALYKILKFEALVASGGEAKAAIADGHVQVNDGIETRKRRQIVGGDVIRFAGEELRICVKN